jgi:glycosyltransferase involved in cell wall biosynthesis
MPDIPLVSVIIPAYNRANTIARAINSVLNQTEQNFEIIVADDGSTDNTVEIVRTFNDRRIHILTHPKNLGPAAARNTAVRNATGKYLALLDSDDEWLPAKLEKQVEALRNAPPGLHACTTGILMIQGDRETVQFPEPITPLQKKLLWGCDFGPGTTLFVERSIYTEIGFMDETLPRCQDWDWLIRYSSKYELMVLPEVLVKVFRNTRPSPEKIEIGNLRIIEKHREEYKLFGIRFEKKALARRWREIAWGYYDLKRDLPKERFYFWRTINADPFQPIGVYVALLDALLGTNLKTTGSRIKAWLFRK